MPNRSAFRSLALLSVLAAVIAGTACVDIISAARYVEREDKRFAVTGKPEVSLSTFDGSIEVRPTDRQEVAVTIEKHAYSKEAAARIEVHAEQNGNRIVVDVRMPKGERTFGFTESTSAKLIVSVPAASDVQATSGDGSIDIERISGTFDLRSGDGSIAARNLTGDVKVHTGDGAITLQDVNGGLDADTGDGSIKMAGKLTSVRARSGDGSVTIVAAPGSSPSEDWDIKTGDGSIVLEVPDGFGGELDAHTGDGTIAIHDITLSNVTGQISKSTVRGRLGAGGHAVRMRTGDGSITVRRS